MKQLSKLGTFSLVIPITIIVLLIVAYLERKKWKRKALVTMLLLYAIVYCYITLFYRDIGKQLLSIELFKSYREAFNYPGKFIDNQAARAILFNMFLFLPFGLIVQGIGQKKWLTILAGIGLSLLTEILQYITRLGMADIDDIINNSIGTLLGALSYQLIRKIASRSL